MTWNLIVFNPINLDEPLASFDDIKTIDELAMMWKEKYNNNFITATKLRNNYHTCKKKEEHFIRVTKN